VPNTSLPVSVNTINGGYPPNNIPPSNPAYYVDNGDPLHSTNSPVANLQFDGRTIVLTATATISSNAWHRVKIAIADYTLDTDPNEGAEDRYYHSAVFINGTSPCP
jgi:hypothetical protein